MPSELQDYIDKTLTVAGKAAYKAIQEVVTEEANACYEAIKENTPVDKGELRDSLEIIPVDGITTIKKKVPRYGYEIDYVGYNDEGVAYSKIGRTLNKGTSKIPARRHITKAVKKLKGMDDRIYDRFLEKVNNAGFTNKDFS